MQNLFLGVSLTASFVGGMLALFAPCCITFLFPSYLGTIFKEKKRVVFLTMIFALGIASILVPVALGFRFIVSFFDDYHTTIYLIGALAMFLIGVMTIFDIKMKLPVPHYMMPEEKNTNVTSTFVLGIFSGITSSCCAPVLFAAITLSTLSPTFLISLTVSLVYVMGIVFPLFLLSVFYEKFSNRYLYNVKKSIEKPLKYLAAFTFIGSSVIIGAMAIAGKIEMKSSMEYSNSLRTFIYELSSKIQNPLIDILFLIVVIVFIFVAVKQSRK